MRGTNTMTLNADTVRAALEYWLNREVLRETVPHTVTKLWVEPSERSNYGGTEYHPTKFVIVIEPIEPKADPEPQP